MAVPTDEADEVVVSWNFTANDGGGVRFEISSRPARDSGAGDNAPAWSSWLAIGEAGAEISKGPWTTRDGDTHVSVDTLLRAEGIAEARVRAVALGTGGSLHRLDLTASAPADSPRLVPDERRAGRIEAPTPFRRNDVNDPTLRSRLCSPLSVRMLLAHRGIEVGIDAFAASIYDERHKIYGNWANAIQAAWEAGSPGYLARFSDWASVREHLGRIGPIAISMTFEEGELTNAPYDASGGHIVVLYGLDERGDALILDPAFGSDPELGGPRRTYARDELSEVWLRRVRGLAYVLTETGDERTK